VREDIATLADEVAALEVRVGDLTYEALRAQVRDAEDDGARELERQLGRVRRSLGKAEAILRNLSAS
jgi:hypothetical protein